MIDLKKIVRKNILELKPYSSARDEFSENSSMSSELLFLDANENPFGELNRYPDPYQLELKQCLAEIKQIPTDQIFIGNGSDEVIDLLFRVFCEPGKDKALTFSPTYGMYNVSSAINDVQLLEVPLNEKFNIDLSITTSYINDNNLKLLFICTPNNPTGNCLNRDAIIEILESFNGIVAIDEAYIDFSSETSWIEILDQFSNLVVIQTFSKARGLAAARIGVCFGSTEIIRLLNKVKPPYNISELNQRAAIASLKSTDKFEREVKILLKERDRLTLELAAIDFVSEVYPSQANFLLVEVDDADLRYQQLVQSGVIPRNRNTVVRNCLRITVGSPNQNDELIGLCNTLSIENNKVAE